MVEWLGAGDRRGRGMRVLEAALDEAARERLEHELRTPLAAIRAIAEILLDEPHLTPAERSRLVEAILAEQARLARTLEALLDQLAGE